jgi:hypothetical protein
MDKDANSSREHPIHSPTAYTAPFSRAMADPAIGSL